MALAWSLRSARLDVLARPRLRALDVVRPRDRSGVSLGARVIWRAATSTGEIAAVIPRLPFSKSSTKHPWTAEKAPPSQTSIGGSRPSRIACSRAAAHSSH